MRRPALPQVWQARVAAWPGLLTLLSVLAVIVGTPARVPAEAPRLTAGNVTPALPELRAAPQPAPGVPLLPPPPALPAWAQRPPLPVAATVPVWHAPSARTELARLGRWQTDGG